jgi:hypothetical protein
MSVAPAVQQPAVANEETEIGFLIARGKWIIFSGCSFLNKDKNIPKLIRDIFNS